MNTELKALGYETMYSIVKAPRIHRRKGKMTEGAKKREGK